MKKIYPNNDEEEDYEDEGIQYWWEQLIVGNRKTKIIQKPEKVRKENSRRILKKSYETTNNKQLSKHLIHLFNFYDLKVIY